MIGIRSITELGSDELATTDMLYGLDRLPAATPMFVYRAPDVLGWRPPSCIELRLDHLGILSRFLPPLIPTGASELNLRMTLNEDQLTFDLVECLCGFFVQICIT